MVLEAGIEPACSDERGILSPLCLPIPPLKHDNNIALCHNVVKDFIKKNAPYWGHLLSSVVSMSVSVVVSVSAMITMRTIRSDGSSSTFYPPNMSTRISIQFISLNTINIPMPSNPNSVGAIISWRPNPRLYKIWLVNMAMRMWGWCVSVCHTS